MKTATPSATPISRYMTHMRIAFLHPKSTFGVLTELCEPAGDNKAAGH